MRIEKVYHAQYQSDGYLDDRWFLHKQQAEDWLNSLQEDECLDREFDHNDIIKTKIPKNANSEWWIRYINSCVIMR